MNTLYFGDNVSTSQRASNLGSACEPVIPRAALVAIGKKLAINAALAERDALIILMGFGLITLAPTNVWAGKKKEKDRYSVRMNELVVTLTLLTTEPPYQENTPAPHRLVTVHVKINNAGKQFPCTRIEPFLEVRPYYQYRLDLLHAKRLPETRELLPGETAEGDYTFDTREGTEPVALVLKAEDIRDQRCTQHPDWGSIWHARSEARLALDGLPTANNSQ